MTQFEFCSCICREMTRISYEIICCCVTRDVKTSRPAWSRDHIFGLGLGLIVVGLDLMGAGLEVSYRGGWLFKLFSQNV